MENYRNGPHSRYDLKYHFVWVTKYRKPVLAGEVGIRLRELVREVCRTNDIEILQGAILYWPHETGPRLWSESCVVRCSPTLIQVKG